MKGVVLCGGASSRMGTDKGMLQLQASNWAQHISTLFKEIDLSFVVSINNKQKTIYSNVFNSGQLIADDIQLKAGGPLLGLLSVHQAFPNEDLLLIACDMIDMQLAPIQLLLNNYKLQSGFNAYLFNACNTLQPLCAIYTAGLLKTILNKLLFGELKRFSLIALLNETNKHISIAPHEWENYFNNYNSPEDLNNLQK